VVMMLEKSRQDVTDCRVVIEAQRAESIPAVFTHINMHFIVTGRGLNAKQVERAVKLSAEKYCSVSIMLSNTVEMSHDVEIRETE
jgi:putative redox protein